MFLAVELPKELTGKLISKVFIGIVDIKLKITLNFSETNQNSKLQNYDSDKARQDNLNAIA